MSATRTREQLNDEEYQLFIGDRVSDEVEFDDETQEDAANAVDDLYEQYEALVAFVLRNQSVFAAFNQLCAAVDEAGATAKSAMQDVEPVGPWKYRDVQRKAAPTSIAYDPSGLPPEILRRPGIVTGIDGKMLDKLATSDLAGYATVLRDARSDVKGTPSIAGLPKAPSTTMTKKIVAVT